MTQLIGTELLILRAGAEQWNSQKHAKYAKFSRNRIKYNIFETYLSYWGYLLAVNLQIYLDTSSLKRANNVLKQPGVHCVAKNWALAIAIGSFLERFVVERANDDLC